MEQYLAQVQELRSKFSSLSSEALGLLPDVLAGFYDIPENM